MPNEVSPKGELTGERSVRENTREPGRDAPPARELARVRAAPHPSVLHDVFGLRLVSPQEPACLKDQSVASSHEGPRTVRGRPTSTWATTTPLVGACISVPAICARSCT